MDWFALYNIEISLEMALEHIALILAKNILAAAEQSLDLRIGLRDELDDQPLDRKSVV